MEVFRIAGEKYSSSLIASGKAARWTRDNQFVLYTGQHRSLSALETVVHLNGMKPALRYKTMVIAIKDDKRLYSEMKPGDLPADWRSMNAYPDLQDLGSEWYATNRSLVLKVPSVIIPQEYNYIINLRHPDFSATTVSLVRNEDYFWDERLL